MTQTLQALLGHPEVLRLGLVFSGLAVLVAIFVPKERRHLSHLGLAYILSLALRVVTGAIPAAGMPSAAATLRFITLLFQGVAFLGLGAVLVFAVLLRAIRIELPRIARDLVVALSYIGLVFYLFTLHHVDVTSIVATSAVVTAIIGFSLQDTLGNVMGGVALQLDGSVAPGDWVKFGDVSGIIREISWRHTAIETRNGDTLIIPNSALMKSAIMLQGRRLGGPLQERRWVYFNVDYRFSPTSVLETISQALSREPIPNVSSAPGPNVILFDFKDSWAVYAVRYWLTDIFLDDPTDSVVRSRVYYALRRAGISLSIPASTIFMESENSERRMRHRTRDHAARVSALEGVSIFRSLTTDERERLADSLIFSPFSPGEALVVQGAAVHHLYVLTRGTVEVRVATDGLPSRAVAQLQAPDFFGEMGMLTGEVRKATVVALTEIECWRLEKERFQEVLQARPKIAEEIAGTLAARDVELMAVKENLSEEAKRLRLQAEHGSLLAKMQRFFGIE
jgi:small-conductance mechanosensitive channel/CRP-like cAMP-binding protein